MSFGSKRPTIIFVVTNFTFLLFMMVMVVDTSDRLYFYMLMNRAQQHGIHE